MDCSPPGSSVHGFSRQEYWTGLPFPSSGDLPDPGIGPESPALQVDFLPLSIREALISMYLCMLACMLSHLNHVRLFVTLWTV